jgi:addiction module RelE/StbE family toxin
MSLSYKLELSSQASKFLKKLKNRKLLEEIVAAFELLKKSPFEGKFLQGDLKGYHSYRIGDYRIIYKVFHRELLIFIEHISHRRESYR